MLFHWSIRTKFVRQSSWKLIIASDFVQLIKFLTPRDDSFEENSRLYLTFIIFRMERVVGSKKENNKKEQWWRLVKIIIDRDIYIVICVAWFYPIIVLRTKEGTLRKETEWKRTNGGDPIDPFSSNFRIHPGSSTNQQVRRPLIRDCLNYPEGNRRDDLQIFNNACYAKIPRTVGVKAFPCARNISRREE